MSEQRLTRQELYDRIRQTSKDEYILSEMKRLGFWDTSSGIPKVSEELITKKGKLQRELSDLVKKQQKHRNREQMLKEMRKKRMAEAKAKREETKDRREKERKERAAKWAEKKETDIVYLGKGVSGGLQNKEFDKAKLEENGLPVLENVVALATSLGCTLSDLRFLAFHRKTSKTSHYKRFQLPKKTGGTRLISAPMPKLKNAQYWVLNNILYKLKTHEAAHGFVPERSIVSNAQVHLNSEVVINIDMKDFFPSISWKRVKGLFKSMGYSEQIATILALICSEPEVDEVEMDGEKYYVAKGDRFLPQGAPTSPAITNLICRKLDKRFEGVAQKIGWRYTRYADDMTFSSDGKRDVSRVLWQAQKIVEDEGFVIHPNKIHVMRKGARQEVTGIVVNEKVNVNRTKLKQFRAVLHKIERNGIEGVKWGNGFILQTIKGFANYVKMVNPEKGEPLVQRVKAILNKPEIKAAMQKWMSTPKAPTTTEQDAKAAENAKTTEAENTSSSSKPSEDKEWWKLW
ncbi:MAG: RNA-directed DNA polymerase [Aureispira sp.]|nr:RNA-directed DNA polymerase [Aureispira sp.]